MEVQQVHRRRPLDHSEQRVLGLQLCAPGAGSAAGPDMSKCPWLLVVPNIEAHSVTQAPEGWLHHEFVELMLDLSPGECTSGQEILTTYTSSCVSANAGTRSRPDLNVGYLESRFRDAERCIGRVRRGRSRALHRAYLRQRVCGPGHAPVTRGEIVEESGTAGWAGGGWERSSRFPGVSDVRGKCWRGGGAATPTSQESKKLESSYLVDVKRGVTVLSISQGSGAIPRERLLRLRCRPRLDQRSEGDSRP